MQYLQTKRIAPELVKKLLRQHNYITNSHYLSNLIILRNSNKTEQPYHDLLYIFPDDQFRSYHHYFSVLIPNIIPSPNDQTHNSKYTIKPGQYINALKLLSSTGHASPLVQCDDITLLDHTSNNEISGDFKIEISNRNTHIPVINQIRIIAPDANYLFSICKIASRFNTNRFTLTILVHPFK